MNFLLPSYWTLMSATGGRSRRQLGADKKGDAPGTAPTPLNLSALSVAAGLLDPKVSGFGPPLSPAELYGGWKFDAAAFDAALAWPGAAVLSLHAPRLLLLKAFLSPEEVAHLVSLAEAGFERSEVVSDGATVTTARTSYGAWRVSFFLLDSFGDISEVGILTLS